MATQDDIWPAAPIHVDTRIKTLITRFFEISDSTDEDSGRFFAEEIFAEDGFFTTHKTLQFRGHDAIAASRQGVPPIITSRGHLLHHVFAKNSPATDLVVLGTFEIGLKDGNHVSLDFTARFIVDAKSINGELRFCHIQVWTDPTDMKAAVQRAQESLKESK